MIYYVSTSGSDSGPGTEDSPFRTINRAAQVAQSGDEVIVHEGTYREWVAPEHGGRTSSARIVYRAADGEHVTIKGSEEVSDWHAAEGGIWKTAVDNSVFGDFNPFAEEIYGDWFVRGGEGRPRHLGDVYLNGKSLYEADSLEAVKSPLKRTRIVDDWTQREVDVFDPEWTQRVWYANVTDDTTEIFANFGEVDPRDQLVEINVRRSVFYPKKTGLNYITVRGFEMAHAAGPWTPPTADQPGLIGPNWAKGWIIEDNDIHDAKCSAVSLGKEASTGDNYFTHRRDKPGYQYQLESVFAAKNIGWDKERIGSHIVRNNVIHDCGQNAVVGHLGAIFSEISGNHIYNIAIKREYYGHEIAGIKLHAAIDTQIHNNLIERCTTGIWLDWQAQGTRVSSNVLFDNCRDIFVEVTHGPHIVDNNLFMSPAAVESFCQGGAFVNNLIAGTLRLEPVIDRATPYHEPHSTDVRGFGVIFGADDRWWGNLFIGAGDKSNDFNAAYDPSKTFHDFTRCSYGTGGYEGHPNSFEGYIQQIMDLMPGDHNIFPYAKQPAYLNHNAYLHGASGLETESSAFEDPSDPKFQIYRTDEGKVVLELRLPSGFDGCNVPVAEGAAFPPVRLVEASFENPDGTDLSFDHDLLGEERTTSGVAGPISTLHSGENRVTVWPIGH